MKSIGIYTNCDKDIELAVTKKLSAIFTAAGYSVYLHKDVLHYGIKCNYFDESDSKLFDTLLTVGGDGTILRIASYCAKNNIAIFGINLGHVGFLTEIERNETDNITELLKDSNLIREQRSLLSVTLDSVHYYALNDIVLSRFSSDRMINLAVYVNGQLVDKYFCDGYIVSTPTGSTAYSLSAGGSILAPDVNALSLLPINSHSLHSRPIIVRDDSEIGISLLAAYEKCSVIADGQVIGNITVNSDLHIEKAKNQLTFLRFKNSNFYEKLLIKLNTWSVTLK